MKRMGVMEDSMMMMMMAVEIRGSVGVVGRGGDGDASRAWRVEEGRRCSWSKVEGRRWLSQD
jgi:hypothetical protein